MNISIAMCSYNGGKYIQGQLDSIVKQTRLPDEIIICDDNSKDNTRKIVENFATSAPFTVHFHSNEKNLGSTKNFDKSISLCSGDIITLCDQDDVWLPHKLARLEEAFSTSSDVGLVFTDAELVDENLHSLNRRLWECVRFGQDEQDIIKAGKAFNLLLEERKVTGSTMAFRANLKNLLLPIPCNIQLIHDGWIALMTAAVAGLAFIDEPLIKYRQHDNQQIGVGDSNYFTPTRNISEIIPHLTSHNDVYMTECHFKIILERLLCHRSALISEEYLLQVEDRISHFHARAHLPESKMSRFPTVLSELLNLRYYRYSNGAKSALKDCLL